MPSAYPGALDTAALFPQDITDDTDSQAGTPRTGTVGFLAQLLRDLGDGLLEVQTELGVNPSGSAVDVATRLNLRPTVKKTVDQAFTTQTLTSITDMALVLAANTDYRFGATMHFNGATARGVGWGLTFSGTTTRLTGIARWGGAVAAATVGTDSYWENTLQASGWTATTATMIATTNFVLTAEGIIQTGATGGTLQWQARQGTGATAGNMNVLKGSFVWVEA